MLERSASPLNWRAREQNWQHRTQLTKSIQAMLSAADTEKQHPIGTRSINTGIPDPGMAQMPAEQPLVQQDLTTV